MDSQEDNQTLMYKQKQQEQQLKERIRSEALTRSTPYNHPQIAVSHEPINAKECVQLQRKLKGLVYNKMDEVRRNQGALMQSTLNYDRIYEEFAVREMNSEMKSQQIYQDIREMHKMADMLLHPPDVYNEKELYLYEKNQVRGLSEQEMQAIYKKYEDAYRSKSEVGDDDMAKEAIDRAKRFLLRKYEDQ